MGKCVVKACDSRSENCPKEGISFHRVPKDLKRRQEWTKAIRLLRKETDWIPTSFTLICSKHFRQEHKKNPKSEGGCATLTRDAIPMLVDKHNPDPKNETSEDKDMEWVDVDDMEIETDEEIEQMIESPCMHKMRQTIEHLRAVSAKRLKKIRCLRAQNKRLKKKNGKLLGVIA